MSGDFEFGENYNLGFDENYTLGFDLTDLDNPVSIIVS